MKTQFILALLLLPVVTAGQQTASGRTVLINKPVHADLYVAAGTVTVNAPVYGDLVVAGGTVTVNDSIANDVIAFGGDISVNATVGDDVRFAGGKLTLNKPVMGDVVVSGGTVAIGKQATIGGGLLSSAGQLVIDGTVTGIVRSTSGAITVNGWLMQSADLAGESITFNGTVDGPTTLAAKHLYIGNDAAFMNRVRYWSEFDHVNFGTTVRKGRPMEDASLMVGHSSWEYLGFASLFALLWYLGAVWALIVFIQYLFGAFMRKLSAAYLLRNVVYSIGYGLLFFVVTPVALCLAMVTIIGIPLALILSVVFALLVLLSIVITSVVLANLFNAYYYRSAKRWRQIWTACGIFVLLKAIGLIPVLGWLVCMLSTLFAFGALVLKILDTRRLNRAHQVPVT